MALTLSDMRTRIKNNTGNTDTTFESVIAACMKTAVKAISSFRDWPELEALATITLNTTNLGVVSIINDLNITNMKDQTPYSITYAKSGGNVWFLEEVTPLQWDINFKPYLSSRTGEPSHYMIWNNTINFFKVPDATYTCTMRYYRWATFPATDDEYFEPRNVDELIEAYTTALVWAAMEESDNSKTWMNITSTLASGLSKDVTRHHNFNQVSKVAKGGARGEYWLDPFFKGR